MVLRFLIDIWLILFSLITGQGDFTAISTHGNLSVMPIHQDSTTLIAA